jgi:hypothetical protein
MTIRARTSDAKISEMRRRRLAGEPCGDIADELDVSVYAVRRYTADLPQDLHEPSQASHRARAEYAEARRLQAREWFRSGEDVRPIAYALGVGIGQVVRAVAGVQRAEQTKRTLYQPRHGETRKYPTPDRVLGPEERARIRELHAEGEPTKVLAYRFGVREAPIVAVLDPEGT